MAGDFRYRDARPRAAKPHSEGGRHVDGTARRYDPPSVAHVNGRRWTKTPRCANEDTYRAFIAQTLWAANLSEDAVYPETGVERDRLRR